MRRSAQVLRLLAVTAVFTASACTSIRSLPQSETAIIDAALASDWSVLGMDHLKAGVGVRDRTFLEPLLQARTDDAGCFIPYPLPASPPHSGIPCLSVPKRLLEALEASNRQSAALSFSSLPSWVHPAPEHGSFLAVSRPGISSTGDSAIVAIAHWSAGSCSSGFVVYLTRHSGKWEVAGFGRIWIT